MYCDSCAALIGALSGRPLKRSRAPDSVAPVINNAEGDDWDDDDDDDEPPPMPANWHVGDQIVDGSK